MAQANLNGFWGFQEFENREELLTTTLFDFIKPFCFVSP